MKEFDNLKQKRKIEEYKITVLKSLKIFLRNTMPVNLEPGVGGPGGIPSGYKSDSKPDSNSH